jgi:hypothetical protein
MYKIVEIEPGLFKLYRKGRFFWRSLQTEEGYAGPSYMVYRSLGDAELGLRAYVRKKEAEAYKKENFKHRKHEYFYGEDGYPARVFKDSNNPGY